MHSQTDQTERPMRAGHDEKLASRTGSGGMARSGESPDASTISRDDRIVWDMADGTTLFAIRTLHMEGDDDGQPVFTNGRAYRITKISPITNPAFVVVVDDHGHDHELHGEHIRAWFSTSIPYKENLPNQAGNMR